MTDLARYLNVLSGGDSTALLEVRATTKLGMRPVWFHAGDDTLPRYIVDYGQRTDTYIGVVPRVRKGGTKSDAGAAHVLWVDIDHAGGLELLAEFHTPTMTVNSGHGTHCYWWLTNPLRGDWIDRANMRLVYALSVPCECGGDDPKCKLCHRGRIGADPNCAERARIMRPPLTFNHKDGERLPVTLESHTSRRYTVGELVGSLPDPPPRPAPEFEPRDPDPNDTLASISPRMYFPRLTGREVGRNGKAQCFSHGDGKERTPSLHVWDAPTRGWACYGCGIGGDIYSLAGRLWDLDWKQADDFKAIRARLVREMR